IVERGDIAPQDLRGAWAGEIGQTQFMPSSYIKFAVDFDSNGRRDLPRSPRTCWPRPPTSSPATAGNAARTGSPAAPISLRSRSGTRARSTPRPSPISRRSFRGRLEQKIQRADRKPTGPLQANLLRRTHVHRLAQM